MKRSINVFMFCAFGCAGQAASAHGMSPEQAEFAALAGPDVAAEASAWEAASVQGQRDHAFALAKRGDGEALLGAVLLYPREFGETSQGSRMLPVPDEVTRWFIQALESAPDDPLLAWLEAVHCPVDAAACDRDAALARLRRSDPENAAVWLEAMRDADERGDVADRDRLFARAAAASRFDHYDRALGRVLVAATRGLRAPVATPSLSAWFRIVSEDTGWPLGEQQVTAQMLALWMHRVIPDLTLAMRACVEGNEIKGNARHRRDCRVLFERVADDSTTALTAMVSLSAMAKLTRDQPDGALWRARYRHYRWLSTTVIELMQPYMPDTYVRNVLLTGELLAWKAMISEAGRPIEPPDGWLPENTNYRDLILTGRSL